MPTLIIRELNGQNVKLFKLKTILYCLPSKMRPTLYGFQRDTFNGFRDDKTVEVKEREILIVPTRVEYRPHTNVEIVLKPTF